jgi:hypothetical protein
MPWSSFSYIFLAVVVAVPHSAAHAQADKAGPRNPGDPKASVPPVRYESPFSRYRPNADVEVGAWRDANQTVGRIGGWRIYGREAVADPKADSGPPAAGQSGSAGGAKVEHGHANRGPR